MTPYDTGRSIGHLTGYILIAVVLIFIVYKLIRRRVNNKNRP